MAQGIDVSHHQGNIDWQKVKSAGIEFAMIRSGYGISNPNQIDKKFYENIEGAQKVGIDVGVYHYSYASSPLDASKEAKFCLEIIKNYKLTYPIVYDIEDATIEKFTRQEKTDMCKAFCDRIEMAGYYAMIYCNCNWLNNHLYAHELLDKYDLWLAHWGVPEPSVACGLWQLSDSGKISGINGCVDLNISYKNYPRIIKSKGLNGFSPEEGNDRSLDPSIFHIVSPGDTVTSIAKKYGVPIAQLVKLNGIQNPDIIYPNQSLRIK